MTWTTIWMKLFGATTLWGLDMGFWAAMAVVCLIVILMNAVFWSLKPEKTDADKDDTCNEFLKDPNQYT